LSAFNIGWRIRLTGPSARSFLKEIYNLAPTLLRNPSALFDASIVHPLLGRVSDGI
jgi:hypothetical protein